jgi:Transcriptional regulator containing an amidase domain and an AraC-type DNA-binding HTH domain
MADKGPHPSSEFDRIVYETGLVRVGAFRCHPSHPSFQDTGPARNFCFVFPRTAVEIQHEHEAAFVANPNVVTFYNAGQSYGRRAISPTGDHCDWFGMESEVVREVVRTFDRRADDRPERAFLLNRGWADSSTYFEQRSLFAEITSRHLIDTLRIEETILELLARVVRSSYSDCAPRPPAEVSSRQRDAIHHAETLLSGNPAERVTLQGVASRVSLSPYHLCRLFRQVTGVKLHQYRLRFRLRAALSEVMDSHRPLTDIALEAGFSSHSHFTDSFRSEFGATPSQMRIPRPATS